MNNAYRQVQREKDGRFGLYSIDPYDHLIGILIAAEAGNVQSAMSHLIDLKPFLRENVINWSKEEGSMFGYVLLRLKAYGICNGLDAVIEAAIKEDLATDWGCLVCKELDLPYVAQVTAGIDGEEYIAWKLGIGSRPEIEPWSKVP